METELSILGVAVDSKLLWTKHISNISKNAGQRLGALRKIANKLDTAGRATVYKAQIRSIMEHACLSWMSTSPTVLNQLDSIHQKALRIIAVNEATACTELAIPSLQHRREVAAVTVLYKMHTSHCPRDLQELLPCPYTSGRTTRASSSMPNNALTMPHAKTSTLDRTFLHSAISIWNASLTPWWEKLRVAVFNLLNSDLTNICYLLGNIVPAFKGLASSHILRAS